jgi:ribosome recycling factor
MYKKIIDKIKPELEKVVGFFEREVSKIRTSHATPSLVEDVVVEYMGQRYALKHLAAISCPEPRQILIQPWDISYIESIVNSLSKTGVGANPVVDKNLIRISLPPLTQEYKKTLIKSISEKKEQTRQSIRRLRDKAWDDIQRGFREGEIREDDKFRGKDELQKVIDEYNKKVDDIFEKKMKEITE